MNWIQLNEFNSIQFNWMNEWKNGFVENEEDLLYSIGKMKKNLPIDAFMSKRGIDKDFTLKLSIKQN